MKKKVIALVLCMIMLVAVSITGTLAYLTSQDQVTNTFTVGNVKITMDEVQVDENGVSVAAGTRVESNTYKVLPGSTYDKDPIIHVGENSENCYLVVYIDNQLAKIEAAGDNTIAKQMVAKGWTDKGDGYWIYSEVAEKGDDVDLFKKFAVNGSTFYSEAAADANNDLNLKNYDNKTIIVKAFAIQAANLTPDEALAQAKELNK